MLFSQDKEGIYNKILISKGTVENRTLLFSVFQIHIIWSDLDPDPYQEALIWIQVAPKINQNHGINNSKWFLNVLFT